MRAPASDLPVMLVEVADRRRRGDDPRRYFADARVWRTDRSDRTERLRQDHPAARRHGTYPRHARPHHLGRPRRLAAGPPRHPVPAPGHAPAQRRRQCPLRAGRRRRAARQRARTAPPNCSRWSASTASNSRPARRLSGGEQQRLALARALARDPEVLFLDEPTASLDPAATKAIEDIVRAVTARGVKVVMSTHDLGAGQTPGRRHRAAASRPPDRERSRGGIFRKPAHAGGAEIHRRRIAGVRNTTTSAVVPAERKRGPGPITTASRFGNDTSMGPRLRGDDNRDNKNGGFTCSTAAR